MLDCIVGTGSTAAELKLRGVGHEAADLVALLRHIELWGHRLYPKANMDELTERLEWLGAKREVRTLLRKMRLGEEDDDAIFNMQLGPAVLTAENAASASGDQKPPPLPPPPQQQMSYGGADSNDDIGELLRKADQDESQFLLETDENELPRCLNDTGSGRGGIERTHRLGARRGQPTGRLGAASATPEEGRRGGLYRDCGRNN